MSSQLKYTPISEIPQIHAHLRDSFRAGKARSIAFRKEQLLQLAYLFQDNLELFQEALRKDLGRPVLESNVCDVSCIITEAMFAYKNIDTWVKSDKAPFAFNFFMLSPTVHKEPKGAVLLISPFNYPLGSLAPITGAIAAGCAVVAKPSEMTPATSQLIAELFPKYLDQGLYRIVNGGVEETTKLLSLKWDHILYTGSGRVGRIVATAAAQHLTPITLELGGKSVDSNTDFELAARRILWGKMLNSGQTCTAPDYVLVPQHVQEQLANALKEQSINFYGTDPRTCGSFSRICALSHWERIASLLNETQGDIVVGGQMDKADKYIAPTIVKNVALTDSLMKEEIFGPILALVPVPDVNAALEYVNNHDNPLALYVFSKDPKFRSYVREHTLTGTFMENDVILQGGSSVIPFGGVGASGYGFHKGKYSFNTFVHHRPSFNSPKWIDFILSMRFPPYTDKTLKQSNAALMSPIPYARPGEKKQFDRKYWVMLVFVLGLVVVNKQSLFHLIKSGSFAGIVRRFLEIGSTSGLRK